MLRPAVNSEQTPLPSLSLCRPARPSLLHPPLGVPISRAMPSSCLREHHSAGLMGQQLGAMKRADPHRRAGRGGARRGIRTVQSRARGPAGAGALPGGMLMGDRAGHSGAG